MKRSKLKAAYKTSDGVTNSILQAWLACEKRSALSLAGWERPGAWSRAIEFGNAFHSLLEKWYMSPADARPDRVFDAWEDEYHDVALATGYPAEMLEEDLAMVAGVWPGYVKKWGKADAKRLWLRTEETFDVQWRGRRLRGKIDGVFKSGKKVWLFETKTKSVISQDDLTNTVAFDPQALYYLTAYQAKTGGKQTPIGVLYNVVRRPALKRGDAESLGKFCERIRADVAKRPDFYFYRFEGVYTSKRVVEFQMQLDRKLLRFADWVEAGCEPMMRECSCTGRYPCKYLEACSTNSMRGYVQSARGNFPELA